MSSFKSTAPSSLAIPDLFSVSGKNVLVTGGGRGIGLMIAEAFVRNGASVYISSRDEKTIAAVAEALTAAGPGNCTAFPADLSSLAGVGVVASTLSGRFGVSQLHCLVNNSGATWGEPLDAFSEKGWDRVMDLNVKSLFFLTRALTPLLAAAATPTRPASVINIGSVAGVQHQSVPTWSYDVSKAAVHHLTRKYADELGGAHITVNCMAPGYVPSKMSKGLPISFDKIASALPLGRVGSAEDMAGCALFLASRAGAWVTGAIIPVDGGHLIKAKI